MQCYGISLFLTKLRKMIVKNLKRKGKKTNRNLRNTRTENEIIVIVYKLLKN